ncbi:RAP protein, putative, partial [Hepatocystis sp. ex Piliocolobus tephrosceles]
MNILKNNSKLLRDVIKCDVNQKCTFRLYHSKKKKSVKFLNQQNNYLKNLCNKNVINNLDCINIIENLKYVTENNVGEYIIKLYLSRIRLLKGQWNLNKIYIIFKTLMKYNIYDNILFNKLNNLINTISVVDPSKNTPHIDPFENIYIFRISYILHCFYHYNHVNIQTIQKLINILNNKLDYIIFYNNYYNIFFYKQRTFGNTDDSIKKAVISTKGTASYNSETIYTDPVLTIYHSVEKLETTQNGHHTRLNNEKEEREEKEEKTEKAEAKEAEKAEAKEEGKKKNMIVRNVNFYEIYFLVSTIKNLKYYDKQFLNKLKLLYYFNCITLDVASASDYKYVTLLFPLFYKVYCDILYNIIKLFISTHFDSGNIHDYCLIMKTIYYVGGSGTDSNSNSGTCSNSNSGNCSNSNSGNC